MIKSEFLKIKKLKKCQKIAIKLKGNKSNNFFYKLINPSFGKGKKRRRSFKIFSVKGESGL